MRGRTAALALAATLALVGCGADGGTPPGDVEVRSGASLTVAEFADVAEADGVVVVDVRTPEEFATGHLADAVNLDVADPAFSERVAALDAETTYAVYCRSGNRSQAAMAAMRERGLTVVDLAGGIVAWVDDGRPVTTG